jgi:hypothetical protein
MSAVPWREQNIGRARWRAGDYIWDVTRLLDRFAEENRAR